MIRATTAADVPAIHAVIRELATSATFASSVPAVPPVSPPANAAISLSN
ncbi:MAG: hypothetical protein JO362_13575 [Streptomycetaceae bacterium]|nr:hypothetical protein [Streptomycetaceae bacterium]